VAPYQKESGGPNLEAHPASPLARSFDYGNAEVNNHDDGAGTMECVYFGVWNATASGWCGGAGSGPWVVSHNGDRARRFLKATGTVGGQRRGWMAVLMSRFAAMSRQSSVNPRDH
jgi:hypothetical protein